VSPEKESAGASAVIGKVEEKMQQGKFQNFLLLGCSLAALFAWMLQTGDDRPGMMILLLDLERGPTESPPVTWFCS
jgi:hypothetical protein